MRGDADGFAQRKAQRVVRHGIYVAQNFGGHTAVIFEAGGGVGDVVLGFDDRLAGIATLEISQVRRFLANAFGEAKQNAAAILRGGLRPRAGIKCCFGSGYGAVHIFFIRFGNFGDDFFGGGIVNGENAAAVRFDKFAVDVHLVFARGRF